MRFERIGFCMSLSIYNLVSLLNSKIMYSIRYFNTFVMTPIISFFYGIKIQVYPNDHLPPHCHCRYAEYKLMVNLATLEIIDGWQPPREQKRVMKRLSNEENRQMLLEEFY